MLGSPVAHSLSPALHQAGYRALGLDDWTYGMVEVGEEALPGFVAGLDSSWRGLSLTMPLKRACLVVADEVSDLAAEVGVGNTLTRLGDGRWHADNTDIGGIVDALRPHWDVLWTSAAILGAGATALSAVYALRELGVRKVTIHARDRAKADTLAARAAGLGMGACGADLFPDGDEPVLVSTLPAGVRLSNQGDGSSGLVFFGSSVERLGHTNRPRGRGSCAKGTYLGTVRPAQSTDVTDPENEAEGTVPATPIEAGDAGRKLFFDVVYDGWPTPLARAALAAGVTVVGGLDMLVGQAARQFEQFTGHVAPVEAMAAAGRTALEAREEGRA